MMALMEDWCGLQALLFQRTYDGKSGIVLVLYQNG